MTREEHLFVILAEECAEIAKVASKALRFGPADFGPGADEVNALLIMREYADLRAVIEMLVAENSTMAQAELMIDWPVALAQKKNKVESFLKYSRSKGRLD